MIAVSIRKDEIQISGHANYAEAGKDIVCAGATTLVQTLIRSIEDLTEDKIEYDISPGRVDIKYRNLSEKAKTLVDSFFIGICMIADEFPDYIQIAGESLSWSDNDFAEYMSDIQLYKDSKNADSHKGGILWL